MKKHKKSKFKKELNYIIKQDKEILKGLADSTTKTEIEIRPKTQRGLDENETQPFKTEG